VKRALTVMISIALGATLLAQQAPDRSHPPAPGPPAPLNLPTIQKQKLSNGLPVWIVETHDVPVAQINLVVLSGTANDPPGKYGVASLVAGMLEEGAGPRSALEIRSSPTSAIAVAALDWLLGTELRFPMTRSEL
jgi:zinc protease